MEMKKLILTMSFPIMISMLVQALYNIVDSMFIARVSEDALAAVSLCYPVQMVMVAVACGTGVGIYALLSRYLGEKKQEKASRVAMHGLFCALCNWIVFALIGIFFSKSFLQLFSDDAQIIAMGIEYMQICTIFSFGVFIQITYERIMQSTGNTVYNMIIQGIGAIVNIILDPIFIFGMFQMPAMGVKGAAVATVAGNHHHTEKSAGNTDALSRLSNRCCNAEIHVSHCGAGHSHAVNHELYDSHDEYDSCVFFGNDRICLQHLLYTAAVCVYGSYGNEQCADPYFGI